MQPEPPAKPTILLVTTTAWVSTARLAMALAEAGCTVDVLCRRGHPVRLTDVVRRQFLFTPSRPRRSIVQAVERSQPNLIVSCDEPALTLLYRIHAYADGTLRQLIERSVGDPAHFSSVIARSRLMQVAKDIGVPIPATMLVPSAEAIPSCIQALGLPIVLKSDVSSGGNGVRVVRHAKDATKIWQRLRGPTSLLRTANRVLRDRDWTPVLSCLRRETRIVTAQQFIPRTASADPALAQPGARETNMAVVCWRGAVLACICLEVVQTWSEGGPASVVRVIDQPEMVEAARKIVGYLGFSGFCGFDFIFSPATRDPVTNAIHPGRPLLLEMNPRPTQVAHLALGPGRDLAAALCCQLLNQPLEERPRATTQTLIALFPNEWQRDPNSPMLRSAFHDVPTGQPALLRAGIRMRANRGQLTLRGLVQGAWDFYTGADLK